MIQDANMSQLLFLIFAVNTMISSKLPNLRQVMEGVKEKSNLDPQALALEREIKEQIHRLEGLCFTMINTMDYDTLEDDFDMVYDKLCRKFKLVKCCEHLGITISDEWCLDFFSDEEASE